MLYRRRARVSGRCRVAEEIPLRVVTVRIRPIDASSGTPLSRFPEDSQKGSTVRRDRQPNDIGEPTSAWHDPGAARPAGLLHDRHSMMNPKDGRLRR
jgi:hypothetical protein